MADIESGWKSWRDVCFATDGAVVMSNTLTGRIYRSTDKRGGPPRVLVTHDYDPESSLVQVENEQRPFRPRWILRRRLLSSEYEFVGLSPSLEAS